VTFTIRADDGIDLIEADGSAGSAACAIKNFVERRLIGLFDQQLQEIFLEGLMCRSCSPPEHGMCTFWHSFDPDAGHGAIMQTTLSA
jgi:hypothetical protein